MNQKTTISVLAFVLVVVLVIRYLVTRKQRTDENKSLIDVRGGLSQPPIGVPVTGRG